MRKNVSDQKKKIKYEFGILFKSVWNGITNKEVIIRDGNWYLAGEGGMISDGI